MASIKEDIKEYIKEIREKYPQESRNISKDASGNAFENQLRYILELLHIPEKGLKGTEYGSTLTHIMLEADNLRACLLKKSVKDAINSKMYNEIAENYNEDVLPSIAIYFSLLKISLNNKKKSEFKEIFEEQWKQQISKRVELKKEEERKRFKE